MKKLHALAKQLKENNFEMTDAIKEQFEEYLSIIAEGSRILHPVFGLGTVKGTQGNTWVVVEFDKDVERWEVRQRENELRKINDPTFYYYQTRRPSRAVQITSCTSIHMLIKKELNR